MRVLNGNKLWHDTTMLISMFQCLT